MDFIKKASELLFSDDESKKQAQMSIEQRELAAHIKQKIQDVRTSGSRVAHEGIWMTNIAYVLGFDSLYYDTNTRQFRVIGRPNSTLRRNRIHVNKILPAVQRRLARLCKNQPKYEIKPDDGSEEAKDRARLEKKVLEHYWNKCRIQEKRLTTIMGAQQAGHHWMKVIWDDQLGELVGKDTDGSYIYEGDINIEPVSAFEVFADPLAKNFDEAQWLIQARIRKLDYFTTHYGNLGKQVKEEDAWLLSLQYEARINSMMGQGPAQTGVQFQLKNSAIEIAYYERRSSKHPYGRMVVIANDLVLEDKPLPCGEIPFVMFSDIPVTGKFLPEAVVTHVRPIQDQINRLLSMRAAWSNKLLTGKYLAAKGSDLDEEAMNDQSGEIVYYNPVPNAAPPQAMTIPTIPQYAYAEEDKLNAMLYDILGEGDVSRGVLPSSSIPAIGMQLLLEQDESRIGVITEQHEHAFAQLGRLILMYGESYIESKRMLKIAGPNDQYVMRKFSGADLKSSHDVTVIRGSLAPSSTAVKRNDIINFYQTGLYGNPQDPSVVQKVLKALEFGDVDGAWEDQALDMAQIKFTIEQIQNGVPPEAHELDNHPLHIQEKNRYRKTEKYRGMPNATKALLLNDIEQHLHWMGKLQAPQAGMPVNGADQVDDETMSIFAELQGAEADQAATGAGPAEQKLNKNIQRREQTLNPGGPNV